MSDVKEKAKALCRTLDIPYPSNEYAAVLRSLREQDRDTRHACAEVAAIKPL